MKTSNVLVILLLIVHVIGCVMFWGNNDVCIVLVLLFMMYPGLLFLQDGVKFIDIDMR